ncbi:MAG: HU family DNA-binding protein [Planctomycetes bacterium]|jgi:DNA-binding protein HU-beta|nr:HU family DNA-binding protein [Planctomycetota bacterium]HON45521.1 HU family DNA-binding protein [Planctomycetota bacterium]HPY75981.1 HU family DNA-binding protein [Planctomycetota bacterium]HQB01513.1 HU family DNA-binding protein [Planctomycetota bacterium]HRU52604.1 HU family DNA-binding protein [Planctomycetota bacterium]
MNKKQLVEQVALELEKSKAEAERAVNVVIDCIKKGLKRDGVVQLIGFGSFNVRKRKARKGRNPKTGEPIKIKAFKTIAFRAGKAFKDLIA